MITLDWTILAAGAVFLFVLWALNTILFRPLLAVIDRRRELTSQTEAGATEQLEYQEKLFQEYANRLKQARQSGFQRADSVRREALAVRQHRLAEAREQAEGVLENSRRQIEGEMASARESLRRDAEEMAGVITARLLEKT